MNRLAIVSLLCATGCFPIIRAINGEEDPDVVEVKDAAAKILPPGCRPQLVAEEKDTDEAMQWLVTGCSSNVACRGSDDGIQCFTAPARLGDFEDARRRRAPFGFAETAKGVQAISGCAASDTRVTLAWKPTKGTPSFGAALASSFSGQRAKWPESSAGYVATNCDREFSCVLPVDGRELEAIGPAECEESRASIDRSSRKFIVDRIGLETGCRSKDVVLGEAIGSGTERAFRLTACGSAYVCTTAAGRTDCKAALSAAPAAPAATEQPAPDAARKPLVPSL